jgi:phage gp36-like protein
MAYVTLQNLVDRYGETLLVELTDRAATPSAQIDTDVTERGRIDAEAMVDGYLAARYGLPLSSVPALLVDLTLKIWIYNLHIYAPGDKIKADYDAAMRALRDISTGLVRIPGVAGAEMPVQGGSGVVYTDRARPFTPETMTGFI